MELFTLQINKSSRLNLKNADYGRSSNNRLGSPVNMFFGLIKWQNTRECVVCTWWKLWLNILL